MRIAITGSSGLIGGVLRRQFARGGHSVTRVVRARRGEAAAAGVATWQPDEGRIASARLEGHDVVIHLAGESIMGVWTASKKRRIRETRVRGTELLARTLASLERPPRALFSASAAGYYGHAPPDVEVTESSPPGEGFLAEVAGAWEASTGPAQEAGIRVVHMRFGNVLARRGGMLAIMIPVFKLGLGAKLGTGKQMWPWIAAAEIPSAVMHVFAHDELSGGVNFVAPQPVSNAEFTETLAAVLGRPSLFRVPEFALRLAPGDFGDDVLLAGARVVPGKLRRSGYTFRHPELRAMLDTLVDGR